MLKNVTQKFQKNLHEVINTAPFKVDNLSVHELVDLGYFSSVIQEEVTRQPDDNMNNHIPERLSPVHLPYSESVLQSFSLLCERIVQRFEQCKDENSLKLYLMYTSNSLDVEEY